MFDNLISISMLRPLRINYPDAIYHVMNRGIARNKIGNEQRDYKELWSGGMGM